MSEIRRLTQQILAYYNWVENVRTSITEQAQAAGLDVTLELAHLTEIELAVRGVEKRLAAICKRHGAASEYERWDAILSWPGVSAVTEEILRGNGAETESGSQTAAL